MLDAGNSYFLVARTLFRPSRTWNIMPKTSIRKLCSVCHDRSYNLENWMFYKHSDVKECSYTWKRCLVCDCEEPTVEGSVSVS